MNKNLSILYESSSRQMVSIWTLHIQLAAACEIASSAYELLTPYITSPHTTSEAAGVARIMQAAFKTIIKEVDPVFPNADQDGAG